jgi:alanyl-tRNA synthetase
LTFPAALHSISLMTAHELKAKYLEFFTRNGHAEISGSSLIPENDPTVLFTTAGMHPLVPYILGEPHPAGRRLVDVQKCIRTGDIEEVGDPSHLTFFEMLGNWSLGDYFKEEAIRLSYEFLTSAGWLGFDPASLWVTVFAGDGRVPADEECAAIWRSLGVPEERISYRGREENWWGPAGQTGPCGPDTEMFIDTGLSPCSPACRPGCHCGKYFEIWNDVFMQYNKSAAGEYLPLEQRTVDTGMGVERTCALLQGKTSVYEIETMLPIIRAVEAESGTSYGGNREADRSMRIVTDHIRSATFILGDDRAVKPSNLGQGYILRRLIRRAIRHARKLGIERDFLAAPAEACIEAQAGAHPELERHRDTILQELAREEKRFLQTLQKGERELEKMLPNLLKNPKRIVPGRVAFRLYDTYGFPIELTEELAAEQGLSVDLPGFQAAYKKHQELSKSGAERAFKGGLADHSERVRRLHTATHLLHRALRQVLGEQVEQKGSNITAERLRFDFSHPRPLTGEEIRRVEQIVNEQISRDLPVHFETMTLDQAKKRGAIALFGERYEERVKVYFVGDFSAEVCGGPHVEHTGELGTFRIVKEQSSSAGVRRIRAVLE